MAKAYKCDICGKLVEMAYSGYTADTDPENNKVVSICTFKSAAKRKKREEIKLPEFLELCGTCVADNLRRLYEQVHCDIAGG